MDLQLAGRVAFVTGGSVGIGYAVAEACAREGMDVTIVSRTAATLERAAATIEEQTGRRVLPVAADVTDGDALDAAMRRTIEEFGRIDVLVNGAAHPGGLVRNEIEVTDPDLLLQDIDIKVIGYVRAIQSAVPHMKSARFGRIINIGGLTGRGSKHLSGLRNVAICHLTKTLSDQLGPFGITVNVVHPGVVETPHIRELYEKEAKIQGLSVEQIEQNYCLATPIRRVLSPAEIADAILFLASPRAAAITGESIGVDGGITRGIFI